jgi:tetratricopeptide (TPR) repeat protein
LGKKLKKFNPKSNILPMETNANLQSERNLKGAEFEKTGNLEKAVELYEENVAEGFKGNHPYDRLATIYKNQNDIENEIRILEKAIIVFEEITIEDRLEGLPKLFRFKNRLEKAVHTKTQLAKQKKSKLK